MCLLTLIDNYVKTAVPIHILSQLDKDYTFLNGLNQLGRYGLNIA